MSLGPDFAILLDVDVLVSLECPNFVVRELDGEALDQCKFMLDLSAS